MQKAFFTKAYNAILQALRGLNLGSYYKTCTELPLYNFIKAVINNDVLWLQKRGFNSIDILDAAWRDILEEYARYSDSGKYKAMLGLVKDIKVAEIKILLVQSLVDELAELYNEDIAGRLRRMGYAFAYNPNDQDQYQRDLIATVNQSKSLVVKRNNSQFELDAMQPKADDKNNAVTETEYDVYLSDLSRFMGFRINAKTTTVSQFLGYIALSKRQPAA